MILEKVLALYDTEPDLRKRRAPARGNPTASAAGNCLAQLQMLRFPDLSHPEMRPIRSAWVLEDGDLHAADLKAKIIRAFPKLTGLSEELFYFPVPVSGEQMAALYRKILDRSLWGTIGNGFVPPRVERGRDGGLGKVRLVDRDPRNRKRPRPLGFVLDTVNGRLWAPLYVDHVVNHPEHGLILAEFKSMSRYGFRRALLGDMDYRAQMQLAMMGEATGLNCVWFCKSKDTSHILEIAFLRDTMKTAVVLTKTNGTKETFLVPKPGFAVNLAGEPVELKEAEDWDVGAVWTPWEPALLMHARQRILDVLLFEPDPDPAVRDRQWTREYGPTFVCETCSGTGVQILRKGSTEPLKKAKPCTDCGETGQMGEAELPNFPCGYCSVVKACWASAQPRLEISDKPRWIVRRADYEASGLTFTPRAEG